MDDSRFEALTPREIDCLRGVMEHKNSGQIGAMLGISEGTVSRYLADARLKLGAATRGEAARMYRDYLASALPIETMGQIEGLGPVNAAVVPPEAIGGAAIRARSKDHGVEEERPSGATLVDVARELAGGLRPESLSQYTRSVLIVASAIAAGTIFLLISVALGALSGLANNLH
jgi:DNA-binding CsgD family transcriptional regulator